MDFGANGRYDSGLVTDADPVQADLLNTNEKDVYNILSTFGGTHVIPPRMFAVRLRYTFQESGRPAR